MRPASYYNQIITWQIATKNVVSEELTGQRKWTYSAGGSLYCRMVDTTARTYTLSDAPATTNTSTIRIRNYPTVKAWDKFTDMDGKVWYVDAVFKNTVDHEMVVYCHTEDKDYE